MNILVTGGTGFFGSKLLSELDNKGCKVSALYRKSKEIERHLKAYKNVNWIEISGDLGSSITDKFDVILHAATHYGRDEEGYLDCVESNIVFPVRLLDGLMKAGSGYFINIDTFFAKEVNDISYMLPYVITKRTFAQIGSGVCNTNKKINFINARLEHLYGPADSEKKFIPFVLGSFIKNVKSIDLTDCQQRRDFIYIDDAVSAINSILNNLGKFSGYNEIGVGTGKSTRIMDMVIQSKEIVGASTEIRFGKLNQRPGEIMDSYADIGKLSQMNWRPTVSLNEGLSLIVSSMATHN